MNTLLTAVNAAFQYNRGRQTGIAGLVGIGLVILIASVWHKLVPIFDYLGIIDFLDKQGLIFEGEGGLTAFAIFMVVLRASLVFILVWTILVGLVVLLANLFSQEWMFRVLLPFLMAFIGLPLIMFLMIRDFVKTPKADRVQAKALHMEKTIEENRPVLDVIRETFENLDVDRGLIRLKRLPTLGDSHFLLALTKTDELYVVVPCFTEPQWAGEIRGEKLTVGREVVINKVENNISSTFKVETENKSYLHLDSGLGRINIDNIVCFFYTTDESFLKLYSEIASSKGYKYHVNSELHIYFHSKKNVQTRLSNALSQEEFDENVVYLREHNAFNEDVVRLMWEDSKQEN